MRYIEEVLSSRDFPQISHNIFLRTHRIDPNLKYEVRKYGRKDNRWGKITYCIINLIRDVILLYGL